MASTLGTDICFYTDGLTWGEALLGQSRLFQLSLLLLFGFAILRHILCSLAGLELTICLCIWSGRIKGMCYPPCTAGHHLLNFSPGVHAGLRFLML